jgi:hypothetical protein
MHVYLSLNHQMATLTERRQVPFRAIGFVVIQVMDGQSVTRLRMVRMPAALALVASGSAEIVPELLSPARRINAYKFAHDSAASLEVSRCRFFFLTLEMIPQEGFVGLFKILLCIVDPESV